jgi:pimeloyl-ACP methyl ester carboxylesterase
VRTAAMIGFNLMEIQQIDAGWPYDIHSYGEAMTLLASSGYRVIVPYLRGCGTTRFLSNGAVRNGEQVVFAHYRAQFTGKCAHRTLPGIGHNVPQEAPQAFAQAILDLESLP